MAKTKVKVMASDDWRVRAKGLDFAKTIIGELDDAVAETGTWPFDDVAATALPPLMNRHAQAMPHWRVTGIVIYSATGVEKRSTWAVYLVKRDLFLGDVLVDDKVIAEMEPYRNLLKSQPHGN